MPALDGAWVDGDLCARGLEGLAAGGRRDLSLVGCASLALVHELHLPRAVTLDRHLAQPGFTVIP